MKDDEKSNLTKRNMTLFSSIIDNIEEIAILFNREGKIFYANALAYKTLDYTIQNFQEMNICNLFENLSFDQFRTQWTRIEESNSLKFDSKMVTKNKILIPVTVKAKIVHDEDKKVGLYIIKKITKQIDDNIESQSNFDFQTIVETSHDGLIILDKELTIIYVNKKITEILGYSKSEMLHQSIKILIFDEDLEDHNKKIDNRIMKISEIFERKLRKKDGAIIWTTVSATPLIDSKGKFNGSFSIVSDITERKKSENEILKLNRLYSTLSSCNEALIQATNENELLTKICDIIVEKGNYKLAWVGYAQSDEQKTVTPMAFAGNGESYLRNIKVSWGDNEFGNGPTGKAIRTGHHQVLNYYDDQFATWKEVAKTHGFVSSAAFPLKDENKVYGTINIYSGVEEVFNESELTLLQELAQDLSYGLTNIRTRNEINQLNKNLEQIVTKRTSELNNLNKELRAFSYTVSHDLRTPLSHLNGYLNKLKDDLLTKLNKEDDYYFQKVLESTNYMKNLIDDILSLSSADYKEINSINVNLSKLLQDVILQFNLETEKRNINWDIGILPIVKCDENLMRLVYVNLISNALKFTKKKDVAKIKIGYNSIGSDYVFYVNDNGAGFDMKDITKLFDVFQRLHDKNEFQGTGLGLAIVRRIINRHGGRTWAEGEIEKGATIYFSLPMPKE